MKTRLLTITRRMAVATLTLGLLLVLAAAPSTATESAETPDDGGKLTIPETSHDRAGLILLGLVGLAALAAGVNAVKQYRGERPQHDGSIRWR